MKKVVILLLLVLSFNAILFSQSWKDIKTVEDVCNAYPGKMKTMLDQFNLNHEGMEKVKQAYDSGNLVDACSGLLEHYKKSNTMQFLRKVQPERGIETDTDADTILKNVFIVQKVKGQVPFGNDGHRNWYYKGPNNDNEWAWLSNRHSQIDYVFTIYLKTGNPKYAKYVDLFLRDFIIKSMPYPGKRTDNSIWRGLEVAARAKVWSRIFYGLINSDYFSPSTQLLMLSSLPHHAHYNRNFHGANNWLTMEISSLATIAAYFPEYKKSPEWLDYAINTIRKSMKVQVYPDGVQTELTSSYHNVALKYFVLFKEICDRVNQPLPDYFNETIEKMYGYIANRVRPDGHRILNNDGDRGNDVQIILDGAKMFKKPEWVYLATNGKSGKKPKDGPSCFYSWAGHLISRSGYDANAHWSFFDIGPWGSGHQHNDKMHLSISAYGRDLLVDAGRFAYHGEVARKFRGYATGSQSHNVVLIDGNGQAPGARLAAKPISGEHFKITDEFDYALGSFDAYNNVKGKVQHTRALFYVRGNLWVVADRIKTDRPRQIETLWHWHPECKVEKAKNGIVTTKNEKGNLSVVPVGDTKWNVNFVKGQEKPEIQGWYSEEYNKYEPNITTVYSTNIESNAIFVWILQPSGKEIPVLEAEIIAQDENMIQLRVSNENGSTLQLDVPFTDSSKANYEKRKK